MMRQDVMRELVFSELGSHPVSEFFRQEHLSLALGLLLDDGRKIVVKVRPHESKHEACAQVQRALFTAGFPCARLLAGPVRCEDSSVSIEEYVEPPMGESYGLAPTAQASGQALHWMMSLVPRTEDLPDLGIAPAWLGWDHPGPGFWPAPDDGPEDLNTIDAPAWLADAARHVRSVLTSATSSRVVGHGDWEAQNVFWSDGRLAVVHDWDSLVCLPEPAVVGAAAGVFAVAGSEPSWPTLEDSRGLLQGYLEARVQASSATLWGEWTDEDERVFWAAGLWVHLFNAMKAIACGEFAPWEERTRQRVKERLPLMIAGPSVVDGDPADGAAFAESLQTGVEWDRSIPA